MTQTATLPPAVPPAEDATSAGPATLEARDITAWFGSHQVLDRVSLTMPASRTAKSPAVEVGNSAATNSAKSV